MQCKGESCCLYATGVKVIVYKYTSMGYAILFDWRRKAQHPLRPAFMRFLGTAGPIYRLVRDKAPYPCTMDRVVLFLLQQSVVCYNLQKY